MTRVTAVLTSFNRRDLTLACLAALHQAAQHAAADLAVVLVDDASTDGTASAVRQQFPLVQVVAGAGDLYWNRGMHQGLALAVQQAPDYLLWLNDDTALLPDSLARMLAEAAALHQQTNREVLLVGSTADAAGALSYGGAVAASRWRRFNYRKVWNAERPVPCDVVNGNCVLVPLALAQAVGNLDPSFEHAMGDTDYALRARRAGFGVFVASGIVGRCANNALAGSFHDTTLPLRVRWRKMMHRKGLPPRSWLTFTRRHGGLLWPLYFAWPYARLLATGWRQAMVRK